MTRTGLILLAASAAGCITPPAVMAAGSNMVVMRAYPPATEMVEVPVEEGISLRGVFAPSDPGAPVVLVLIGAGDSVSLGGGACSNIAWDLRDRGFGALLLDWRGVGVSDGDCSPWNLRGDARAAFGEAVRRAGGEERVVVRGMSLGTLAAAALLEEGARPAAVVLVTPVRGETVAVNFAYSAYWDPLVFLAAPFLRSVGDADLAAAVRACPVPLLVLVGDRDSLLPPEEEAMVREACLAAGGRFVHRPALGHEGTYMEAAKVFPEEAEMLERLFPGVPPVGARAAAMRRAAPGEIPAPDGRFLRDPPALGAALALAGTDPDREDWLRTIPGDRLRAFPFDALLALVSFQDPAGDLDPRELYAARGLVDAFTENGHLPMKADGLAKLASAFSLGRKSTWTEPLPAQFRFLGALGVATESFDLDAPKGEMPAAAPARLQLPPRESLRQAVRIMLKAAGIPDRMREGAGVLEAWEDGAWRAVDLAGLR